MDIFTYLVLIIIQIFMTGFSVKQLLRQPFSIITINVFLTIVFFFIPAWAWIAGDKDFSYSWRYFMFADSIAPTNPIVIATLITLSLLVGSILGSTMVKNNRSAIKIQIQKTKLFNAIIKICILLWGVLFLWLLSRSGISIIKFITPNLKYDIFPSYYVKNLYLTLPIVIITLYYLEKRRFNVKTNIWIIISLITSSATAQRRDAIVVVLFLIALKFIMSGEPLRINIKNFNKYFKIGIVAISLVPILWWARVWYDMKSKTGYVSIMPWEHRGALEVIFGGQATGFPTFLLVYDWVSNTGVKWGYSIWVTLTSFIPRSIWLNKPITPSDLLQAEYGLSTNPSMFFINELYLSFGILSFIFAFILGFIMSWMYKKFMNSRMISKRMILVILFSQFVTFFKNGIHVFSVNTIFMIIMLLISIKLSFRNELPGVEK